MDPFEQLKIDCAKKALKSSGLLEKYNVRLEGSKLIISNKEKKKKENKIDSRFELLDL